MPARIVVWSGTAVEHEHWIEGPVVRIGSDAASDLVLPGVPAHALTVQFRAGRYRVFNRTRQPLRLGDAALPPDRSELWLPGRPLPLPIGSALYLVIDGDPAPQPRRRLPTEAAPDLDETPPPLPAAGAASGRKARQYATLATCLIAAVLLLLFGPESPDATAEFAQLRDRHRRSVDANDLAPVVETLQTARRRELRRDYAGAVKTYVEVRTLLAGRVRRQGLAPSDIETAVNDFAARRIRALSGRNG